MRMFSFCYQIHFLVFFSKCILSRGSSIFAFSMAFFMYSCILIDFQKIPVLQLMPKYTNLKFLYRSQNQTYSLF